MSRSSASRPTKVMFAKSVFQYCFGRAGGNAGSASGSDPEDAACMKPRWSKRSLWVGILVAGMGCRDAAAVAALVRDAPAAFLLGMAALRLMEE